MMTSTTTTATAACSLVNRPTRLSSIGAAVSACNCNYNSNSNSRRRGRVVSCGVAVKSSNSTTSVELDDKFASVSATLDEEEEAAKKVGSRVKVKVGGLKVYHVPRVAEVVDLSGMEGVVKQYVGVWKGKKISANLPYKVEFVTQVEGRGAVKFVAHLKEDEFDFLD